MAKKKKKPSKVAPKRPSRSKRVLKKKSKKTTPKIKAKSKPKSKPKIKAKIKPKKSTIKVNGKTIVRVAQKTTLKGKQLSATKKERKRAYDRKYYWIAKWKKAKNTKAGNKAFKEVRLQQIELNKLNKKLGISYELPKLPDKKYFKDGKERTNVNIWEGPKEIRALQKRKAYKKITIEGKTYNLSAKTKVLKAFNKMEKKAYKIPRNTPRIEFVFDKLTKTITLTIY